MSSQAIDVAHSWMGGPVAMVERRAYELSSDAIGLGLDAALPHVMELKGKVAEFGRGTTGCKSSNSRGLRLIALR